MTKSTLPKFLLCSNAFFFSLQSKQKKDILLNVILPLLVGIGVYESSKVIILNTYIRNYFPDGLWAYSFVSCLLIIWNRRINLFWIVSIFIFFIAFEVFQHFEVINGTGDYIDVLIYFGCSTIALLTNKYFIN
jgi:hypothetical protein